MNNKLSKVAVNAIPMNIPLKNSPNNDFVNRKNLLK
jgi:hypothetical protein